MKYNRMMHDVQFRRFNLSNIWSIIYQKAGNFLQSSPVYLNFFFRIQQFKMNLTQTEEDYFDLKDEEMAQLWEIFVIIYTYCDETFISSSEQIDD